MVSTDLILIVVSIIGNFLLGSLTFIKNPKSVTNRLFFIFTLNIILYLICNYFSLHQSQPYFMLMWVKIVMAIAVGINLSFFLLAHNFPSHTLKITPVILAAFFSSIILLPLTQTSFIFSSIDPIRMQPVAAAGMAIFLLHTILFLGGGVLSLIFKIKHTSGIVKKQIQLFLLGAVLMFVSIVITNIILVLVFKISDFVKFLPLYTLVFVSAVSYSILKHRFLDIRLIVVRSLVYSVLATILSGFYIFIFVVGATYFTGITINPINLTTSIILILITSFSLVPVKKQLENTLGKLFYKQHYDTTILLNSLSHIMASTLKLADISSLIVTELLQQIQILSGHIILTKGDTIIWKESYGNTKPLELHKDQIKDITDAAARKVNENILIFDELNESPIKHLLREKQIGLVFPLIVKEETIGLVLFGDKSSGDIYSLEDINIFKIIQTEFAIAIKNSLSYEEIKNFNLTLEDEVLHATKKLEKANERLTELDKLKDEFVSIASHELRTPMTAIKSYLWMALFKTPGKMEPQLKHYLEIAYTSTEELLKLVQNMLTISRIEGNRIELVMEPFNLNDLAHDIYDELKIRADERGIHMRYVSHPLNCPVYADKARIREVIQNILGNALKFTPDKGNITMSVMAQNNKVTTSITDTGPGISPENMAKLFQKFARLSSSYKNQSTAVTGGTGLGLYITKQIIELHKGHIDVQSEVGKGSTFSFELAQHHNK